MPQEREIEGEAELTLASRWSLLYDWWACAHISKYNANGFDHLKIKWPIALEDPDGERVNLPEAMCRLLAYHDGAKFVSLRDLVLADAEARVAEIVRDMEFDYDAEADDAADRAYDEWRDRKWEESR